MRSIVRTTVAACVGSLLAVGLISCQASAQDDSAQPPAVAEQGFDGVVVLEDGGVLAGRIVRSGGRFVVARAGGELQVPAANVMLACRSMEEAYDHRRAEMKRPNAEAHLALAEWCLRHGLLPPATRELADARKLEPAHPTLALLERRLANVSQPMTPPQSAPAIATQAPQPVHHGEQPAPKAADLRHDVVELFTRRVQPVLVNNCTTSGCHRPGGEQQFQLDRALLHGVANRRSTMRNLAAVLAIVDRDRPQLSPLLVVPRRTHGEMDKPVFGPRQDHAFQHLVDWVALVTQPEAGEQNAAAAEEGEVAANGDEASPRLTSPILRVGRPTAAQETTGFPRSVIVEQVTPLEVTNGASGAGASVENDRAQLQLRPKQPLRYGAQLQAWSPRDPFDPEIFNRQRPRQPPAAVATSDPGEEKR